MQPVKLTATLLLLSLAAVLSSLTFPGYRANHVCKKDHAAKFCGANFGVDNQALTTCTLTVARLSPTTSGTVLIYNLSYASGQSSLFAFDPLNLQSTVTIKGNITGTWSSVAAIRASDGFVYDTWANNSSSTVFALFGTPNICGDDIYLLIH
jgi:hypothetical protein